LESLHRDVGCPITKYCPARTRFLANFFVDSPTVLTSFADAPVMLLPLTVPVAQPAIRDRQVVDTVTPFCCFFGGLIMFT